MSSASGLQIAFLIFAFEFLSMLIARIVAPEVGWPQDQFVLLANAISFPLAAILLFGIRPVRRSFIHEFGRALPKVSLAELLAVSLAKGGIPFALVGFTVAWHFTFGSPEGIVQTIQIADAAEHWSWTLSPIGLFEAVVLSCLVGPIIEEIVFRGILYRAWERQFGWVPAMLLSSICFGLMHPTHVLSSLLGGVVFVCVLRRSGTLWACIVVHSLFNLLISWPLLGRILFAAPAGDPARLGTWTFQLACLALVVTALPAYVWVSRKDARAPSTK